MILTKVGCYFLLFSSSLMAIASAFDSSIDFDTQTPRFGNHKAQIHHKKIDHETLTANNSNVKSAIVGFVTRSLFRSREVSLQRNLSDFDELNDIFKDLVIALPDIYINAGKFLGATARFWATELKCFGLGIDDITIDHKRNGKKEYDFKVGIDGLAISCTLDWRYQWSFANGNGSATVVTTDNVADTEITFISTDFNNHPPSKSTVAACNAAIEIDDMEFKGGIVAGIVNLLESSLRSTIEGEINAVACQELGSIGTTLVEEILEYVADLLDSYLAELPTELSDFLYAEKTLPEPESLKLLNLSGLDDSIGDWFQAGLRAVDQLLGTLTPDPNSPTGTGLDLGINKILRSSVLGSDRSFSMNFTDNVIFEGHDMLTETRIELDQFKIFGLDTFTNFDPLNSAGRLTLLNHFMWKELTVELDLSLSMKPSTLSDSIIEIGAGEILETVQLKIGLDNTDVDFHFLLAVDETKVGALQLGSISNTTHIIPCFLDTIYKTEVTGFAVDIENMETPTMSGFISPGIDRLVSSSADAVFEMYEATLIKALPNFFQIAVRNIVDDLITNALGAVNTDCPSYTLEVGSSDPYINFGDLLLPQGKAIEVEGIGSSPYGNLFRDAMSLVNNEILKVNPVDGNSYVNELVVSKLTEIQSGVPGTLSFPNELGTSLKLSIGELNADIEIKLSEMSMANVDTIGVPLTILQPSGPHVLDNTVTLGAGSEPLEGSMQLVIGFSDGGDIAIHNTVDLKASMNGTTINVAALVSILESPFMNFPVSDLLNPNCWMSLIPAPLLDSKGVRTANSELTLALEKLGLNISTLQLQLECKSCTSPKLEELATLISSPEAFQEMTELFNGVVDYIFDLLGGTFLQVQLDRKLSESSAKCPHHPSYIGVGGSNINYESFDYQKQPNDPLTFMYALGGAIGLLFLGSLLAVTVVKVVRHNQHLHWVDSLSPGEFIFFEEKQKREKERDHRMNATTTAMVMSPSIPLLVRLIIPVLVLVNVGLFLSGHLSLGASVDFEISLAGEAFRIKEVFVFSMANSIMDMWDAGAKELAILILIFSGIWPYTKQIMVFICWFTPPKWISVSRRESIFKWLDALGKWSFVDIFVLIMSIASFRVGINTPEDLSYLPADFFKLDLLVVPCFGLYANMTAQILSQIVSHYLIHYHRIIVSKVDEEHEQDKLLENKNHVNDPLRKHAFDRTGLKKGYFLQIRPFTNVLLVVGAMSTAVALICGCIRPSFSLEQYGLVGLASEKPFVVHDIVSIINLLIDQAKFTGVITDYIGLGILSLVLVATVLVVPLVQLALQLRRWFMPLSKKQHMRNFVAIEALQAWQYVEVFLFSIVVACWQLGSVSEFLINDYCKDLSEEFAMLQYYGILAVEDAQCFRVSATVQPGTWIFLAASCLLMTINSFVDAAASQQSEDIMPVNNNDIKVVADSMGGINAESSDLSLSPHFRRRKLQMESARFTDYYRWFLRRKVSQ